MDFKFKKELILNNLNDTNEFGLKLAKLLPNGSTVLLDGDLGAGKTTLVRAIAKGLNIKEVVQSPTFNIMKIYLKGDRPLIHIDAYRLKDNNVDIGLDEYIGYELGLTFIEWSQYIENLLPKNSIMISLINENHNENRKVIIRSNDEGLINQI